MPKVFQKPLDPQTELETPNVIDQRHHFDEEFPEDLGINENLVRTLLEWRAPSRAYRKKDRSYYLTVAILVVLTSAIAFVFGEKLLIGVFLATAFLMYVLNFVPPEEVENKLSTQGVTIGDHFYHWQELDSFWFSQKEGHQILNILTNIRFPGVLMLLLDGVEEEEVKRICAKYLPFHEIAPKTLMDKWSEGLVKHFPLEKIS